MITNTSVNQKSVWTATWKAAADAGDDRLAGRRPLDQARGQGQDPDERDEDREQPADEGAPDRVHVRPEQVVGPAAGVARGQGARVAQLGQRGAFGSIGGERPVGGLRVDGVGDQRADLSLELGAVAARDAAQDGLDVAVRQGGCEWRSCLVSQVEAADGGIESLPVGEQLGGEALAVGVGR